MVAHHASPSEIVDLETWAQDLPDEPHSIQAITDAVVLLTTIFKD